MITSCALQPLWIKEAFGDDAYVSHPAPTTLTEVRDGIHPQRSCGRFYLPMERPRVARDDSGPLKRQKIN